MNALTLSSLGAVGVEELNPASLVAVNGGELLPGWLVKAGEELLKCIIDSADKLVDGIRDGFNAA
jgi:hypothetical protein